MLTAVYTTSEKLDPCSACLQLALQLRLHNLAVPSVIEWCVLMHSVRIIVWKLNSFQFSVKVTFKKQNTYRIFALQLKNMPVIIAISVPVSSPLNEKHLQLCLHISGCISLSIYNENGIVQTKAHSCKCSVYYTTTQLHSVTSVTFVTSAWLHLGLWVQYIPAVKYSQANYISHCYRVRKGAVVKWLKCLWELVLFPMCVMLNRPNWPSVATCFIRRCVCIPNHMHKCMLQPF